MRWFCKFGGAPIWGSAKTENHMLSSPGHALRQDPLEAILVIFGRRGLIFFAWKLLKKYEKWHHFCAHAQWWSPWRPKNVKTLPAMQWHAHKRLFAFLSGNLALLFLRLQYVLNVFIFRSFVKSLLMPIDSLLTTIFFLETKSLPSIPTKRYESEPDLPKPKLLLPNAGQSNRHCLSIEKTPNRQRRGK